MISKIDLKHDADHGAPEVYTGEVKSDCTSMYCTPGTTARIETEHGTIRIHEDGKIEIHYNRMRPLVKPVAGNALEVFPEQ